MIFNNKKYIFSINKKKKIYFNTDDLIFILIKSYHKTNLNKI